MFMTTVLTEHATNTPDQPAIIFEHNEWTYKELYENARKIAHFIQEQGYQKGDVIAQFMLNTDLFMAVYFGVQLAGCTVMPINTKLPQR